MFDQRAYFLTALAASIAIHAGFAILSNPGAPPSQDNNAPRLSPAVSLLAPSQAQAFRQAPPLGASQEAMLGDHSSPATRHAIIHADDYYHETPAASFEEPDLSSMICEGKDASYEGVGMIIQPGSNRVISAPPQYPAYKAGIRKGDRIADPYGPAARHGVVAFVVEGAHGARTVRIRMAKICFRPQK